jgi:hypothetical protein
MLGGTDATLNVTVSNNSFEKYEMPQLTASFESSKNSALGNVV